MTRSTVLKSDKNVRCLVFTGEGRAFCSGQDLSERRDRPANFDAGESLDKNYNPLVRRLAAFPIPTIAAVNGPAAGAGANIALACDVILMARSAYMQQAFARIGLVPDAGGTWFLPRLVGLKHALAMCLFADRIPAEDCERMGIAWKIFDDEIFVGRSRKARGHSRRWPDARLSPDQKGADGERSPMTSRPNSILNATTSARRPDPRTSRRASPPLSKSACRVSRANSRAHQPPEML